MQLSALSGPTRVAAVALALFSTTAAFGQESRDAAHRDAAHWPTWRGPLGTGVANGTAPVEWSDDENIRWRIDIPGRGFSTPIVWGSKLFLTTAVPLEDPPEAPQQEQSSGRRGGFRTDPVVRTAFLTMCIDRGTGEVLWERVAREATPHEGFHKSYGSHASASPITDGERLFVSFGSFGIYAYDLDGKLLWETDMDVKMRMRNRFGEGAAPVLHGDTLVIGFDQEEDSFIVALDATTGEERWRNARDEPTTWAMPLITEVDVKQQVVTSGTNMVRSYDLDSGELIWECGGLGLNAIPAVMRHEDLVLAMTGYREANLLAIRLGGKSGDLTDTDAIAWSTTKGTSYTASPVLHEGIYYAVQDRGFISAWDAGTGEPHYVAERLPRGSTLKASPIAAGGHLYVATESGDVHVIKLGTEYELVGTNTLADQFFVASPLAVEGQLILRSRTDLICVGDQ